MGLSPASFDPNRPLAGEGPLWDELRKKGWTLGENVVIERVYANEKMDRLLGLAEELVRKGVDLIVTDAGEVAAVAAARDPKHPDPLLWWCCLAGGVWLGG